MGGLIQHASHFLQNVDVNQPSPCSIRVETVSIATRNEWLYLPRETAASLSEFTGNPTFPRGEGWATSSTSNIAPMLAEGAFDILGYDSVAFGAGFDTRIFFEFAVEPLEPGLTGLVPIDVTMSMGIALDMSNEVTGIADSGNVSAILGIPGFWTWSIGKSCSAPLGCTGDLLSFAETRTGDVSPDTVYTGEMRVTGHAQGGGLDFFAAASAFVDPTIVINPDFEDADKYRVVFGSGISAIPVPAALPLFLSAMAGLVILGWRRRGVVE